MLNTTGIMLIVFFKSIITFVLVLIVLRLMGKRQLGEMQPFELVITLIIAEVACIPMNDPFIPFYSGIVPIITLGTLHITLSFLARKSMTLRRIMSGQSVLAIDKNGINYQNLKKMNLNVNDLIEAVRSSGYVDFSLIEYAIFETNGKLCVVEKPSNDEKNDSKEALLPLSLLVDGVWIEEHLSISGATIPQVNKVLSKRGLKRLKDVLYVDVRQDGKLYVSPKYEKYFVDSIKLSGGGNW